MHPIKGDRYTCLDCEDYDLCENCYNFKDELHHKHTFKCNDNILTNKNIKNDLVESTEASKKISINENIKINNDIDVIFDETQSNVQEKKDINSITDIIQENNNNINVN